MGTILHSFAVTGCVLGPLCQTLINDKRNACLIPYAVLQLAAVACGIVAAMRGSKWWLVWSLVGAFLAAQGISVFVETIAQ